MKVVKRDKTIENYSQKKVDAAIRSAFKSVGEKYDKNVMFAVDTAVKAIDSRTPFRIEPKTRDSISVEEIQDVIESKLLDYNYLNVLRSFILYREKHKTIRSYAQNKLEWINKYIESFNSADATIDDNSNVGNKNIAVLNGESHKTDNKEINRFLITRKLRELYPDFDAKQYVRDLESHIIYKHDENTMSIIAPYCMAVTMDPFLKDGIKGLGGLSVCPKNLDSFCGIYVNLVFALSSQVLGAVATPSFFILFDYFARKDFGKNYMKHLDLPAKIKYDQDFNPFNIDIETQIKQHFQQVVYTINQPAGNRSYQSPFTNFSYFDENYFQEMYGHYMFPDGSYAEWDSIFELQKLFMKWFNKERTKCILTFPVESVSLLQKDGEFVDKRMSELVAEEYAEGHSFFTYISDSVDSLSSCCFDGKEVLELVGEDGLPFMVSIKDFVLSQTQKIDPIGTTNLNTKCKINSFDLNGETKLTNITGVLMKEYTGKMYKIVVGGKEIEVTGDHPLMVLDNLDDKVKEILTEDFCKDLDRYLIAIED